jgi:hypothetical protein
MELLSICEVAKMHPKTPALRSLGKRSDCKECQFLQNQYNKIGEAYAALYRMIQTDDTVKNNPKSAEMLDERLHYMENAMANVSDAIRQHQVDAHSDRAVPELETMDDWVHAKPTLRARSTNR